MKNFSRRELLKLSGLMPLAYSIPAVKKIAPRIQNNQAPKQNVLVIVFDTFSSMDMSLYGYPRLTTPNFNRIAEKAHVYHNHYASGPFTTPGTSGLLTGAYPWSTRAFKVDGGVIGKYEENNLFSFFNQYHRVAYTHNSLVNSLLKDMDVHIDDFVDREDLYAIKDYVLGELLEDDFDTGFFFLRQLYRDTDGYYNSLFLSDLLNKLDSKLETKEELNKRFKQQFPLGVPGGEGGKFFLEDGINYIKNKLIKYREPFMGYFHFYPPHGPYLTRHEFHNVFLRDSYKAIKKPKHFFTEKRTQKSLIKGRRRYDEFILYVDAEMGRLYDYLETSGVLDNTWVVITSDHAEMHERGIFGHSSEALLNTVLKIPLLILEPGQSTRNDVFANTSAVDVLPTLLKVTQQESPVDFFDGRVMPPFRDTPENNLGTVYSNHARLNGKNDPISIASIAIMKEEYKLVKYFGYPQI
ncbi:MAG: sulfatase-like hydrolase/transferase, partial [Chloroflexota bacterium]